MDDKKNCSKCERNSTKSYFYKDISTKDGLNPVCKICRKGYYFKNHEKLKEYRKQYKKQNIKQKIKKYEKTRRKRDLNFKFSHNIICRISKAFKSQNVENLNKTFEIIQCSHKFLRKLNLYQLYGIMTIENYGSAWCIDPCYKLAKCHLIDKEDLYRKKIGLI